jgi:hypothetical protein
MLAAEKRKASVGGYTQGPVELVFFETTSFGKATMRLSGLSIASNH